MKPEQRAELGAELVRIVEAWDTIAQRSKGREREEALVFADAVDGYRKSLLPDLVAGPKRIKPTESTKQRRESVRIGERVNPFKPV